MSTVEEQKRDAGYAAVDRFVTDGMRIGLGTGSTAYFAIERVGALVRAGADIAAVPTSAATEALCARFGVRTIPIPTVERLAVAIDGADEIDPHFNLIKGAGGALLREKIVAQRADRFVIVADASKCVPVLGAFPLPVEVVPFAAPVVGAMLRSMPGVRVTLRERDGNAYVTDNGNLIYDCTFGRIDDPERVLHSLSAHDGVVSVGLFVGLATDVLVAGPDGVSALQRAG